MEIILVNHGSRRESFNYLMYKWAKELERRLGVPCVVGFNEYADPNWRDLLKRGNGPAVLALAFLGEGNHVARDILNELGVKPGEWAQSSYGRQIYVTPPLGNSPLVFTALLARVRESLGARPLDIVSEPEEIEESSMRYVAEALGLDLTQWKDRLVARVAYATGNLDVAKHLWVSDDLLDAAREAFMAEMPLLVDTKMVAAGVKYAKVHTAVGTSCLGMTKSACGITYKLRELGAAMLAVGNAPTALEAALRVYENGEAELAFMVATPVGFTNAAIVKEKAARSGLPGVVLLGTYGGSGVAAALFNELSRLAYGG